MRIPICRREVNQKTREKHRRRERVEIEKQYREKCALFEPLTAIDQERIMRQVQKDMKKPEIETAIRKGELGICGPFCTLFAAVALATNYARKFNRTIQL